MKFRTQSNTNKMSWATAASLAEARRRLANPEEYLAEERRAAEARQKESDAWDREMEFIRMQRADKARADESYGANPTLYHPLGAHSRASDTYGEGPGYTGYRWGGFREIPVETIPEKQRRLDQPIPLGASGPRFGLGPGPDIDNTIAGGEAGGEFSDIFENKGQHQRAQRAVQLAQQQQQQQPTTGWRQHALLHAPAPIRHTDALMNQMLSSIHAANAAHARNLRIDNTIAGGEAGGFYSALTDKLQGELLPGAAAGVLETIFPGLAAADDDETNDDEEEEEQQPEDEEEEQQEQQPDDRRRQRDADDVGEHPVPQRPFDFDEFKQATLRALRQIVVSSQGTMQQREAWAERLYDPANPLPPQAQVGTLVHTRARPRPSMRLVRESTPMLRMNNHLTRFLRERMVWTEDMLTMANHMALVQHVLRRYAGSPWIASFDNIVQTMSRIPSLAEAADVCNWLYLLAMHYGDLLDDKEADLRIMMGDMFSLAYYYNLEGLARPSRQTYNDDVDRSRSKAADIMSDYTSYITFFIEYVMVLYLVDLLVNMGVDKRWV
jgi:hypothetical protein